jgi:hypothetical protein
LSGTGNSGWVKQTLNYNSGEGGKQSGVFSGSGSVSFSTGGGGSGSGGQLRHPVTDALDPEG